MYGNINLVHMKACSIKDIVEKMGRTDYEVKTQEELGVGARANTILAPRKLLDAGFKFVNFDEELKHCINKLDEEIKYVARRYSEGI